MGANVWQRDGNSGRTFQVGPSAPQQSGRGGRGGRAAPGRGSGLKRKLVWSRDGNGGASSSTAAQQDAEPSPGAAKPPLKQSFANSDVGIPAQSGAQPQASAGGAAASSASADVHDSPAASDGAPAPKRHRMGARAPGSRLNPQAMPFGGNAASANIAAQSGASPPDNPGGPQTNGAAIGTSAPLSQHPGSSHGPKFTADGASSHPGGVNISSGTGEDGGGVKPQLTAEEALAERVRQQKARMAAAAALAAKQKELLQLRRTVQQKQRRLSAQQEAARIAAETAAQQAAADAAKAARSRQRLQAAFADAFREAAEAAATEAPKAAAPPAGAAEVARVLTARSDYACLRLPEGSGRDVIRQRYREMAKALHPDKCSDPRAKDAFQRLFEAYSNLTSYAA